MNNFEKFEFWVPFYVKKVPIWSPFCSKLGPHWVPFLQFLGPHEIGEQCHRFSPITIKSSCEMSRLHCFHKVAHHQTENLFAGCGQLSECPRSIQRLIFFSSITNPPKLHQLQCAWLTGCWRLHPPPPRCPLSSRDGWLGPGWKDKDGRGKLFSVPHDNYQHSSQD